ncbi:MAG: SH3 domain-containing protein, partial [Simkania sp.]|nr:SH3 domain-containing protein [Simkania sp.]
MFKPFAYALAVLAFVSVSSLQAEQTEAKATSARSGSSFKSFTGKVLGNNVRMRTSPDLDSHIVSELLKDDYVVVTAEKGEFYAVEPPSEMKAYIFRGFVIDDVVEGDRVNVRLAPDRDAPIVGHHSTGDK